MRINKFLKNRKGNVLIFAMIIVVIFIFMTIFLIDIGLGYMGKVQMQNINDACAIAGASAGAYAYISKTVDQTPRAIVKPDVANSKASQVFSQNLKYLSPRFDIDFPTANPNGEIIDGKPMSSLQQYYSGNYTVKMTGRYYTFFPMVNIFGLNINLPYLTYHTEARVHVSPQVVK